jgi:hypothetical protein
MPNAINWPLQTEIIKTEMQRSKSLRPLTWVVCTLLLVLLALAVATPVYVSQSRTPIALSTGANAVSIQPVSSAFAPGGLQVAAGENRPIYIGPDPRQVFPGGYSCSGNSVFGVGSVDVVFWRCTP